MGLKEDPQIHNESHKRIFENNVIESIRLSMQQQNKTSWKISISAL